MELHQLLREEITIQEANKNAPYGLVDRAPVRFDTAVEAVLKTLRATSLISLVNSHVPFFEDLLVIAAKFAGLGNLYGSWEGQYTQEYGINSVLHFLTNCPCRHDGLNRSFSYIQARYRQLREILLSETIDAAELQQALGDFRQSVSDMITDLSTDEQAYAWEPGPVRCNIKNAVYSLSEQSGRGWKIDVF